MEEETDLPKAPRLIRPLKRYRTSHEDSNTSSDPIFSSDGPEPSAEDYGAPRTCKRQFRGPWWNSGKSSRRHDMTRKVDSGIYVASDEAEDLADTWAPSSPMLDAEGYNNPWVPTSIPTGAENDEVEEDSADAWMPSSAVLDSEDDALSQDIDILEAEHALVHSSRSSFPPCQDLSAPEREAGRIVMHCIENSVEIVDLSNLGLESVPYGLLGLLNQIIKPPQMNIFMGSPEHYSSFQSELTLILSQNHLRSVPPSIFDLKDLKTLSLRGNELQELPGFISQLRNLTELNLANNHLRWLPYELLELMGKDGELEQLRLLPNPLVKGLPRPTEGFERVELALTHERLNDVLVRTRTEIEERAGQINHRQRDWVYRIHEERLSQLRTLREAENLKEEELVAKVDLLLLNSKPVPVRIAKSKIAFFGPDGLLLPNSVASPSQSALSSPSAMLIPGYLDGASAPPPEHGSVSFVPSLFELALKTSRASVHFPEMQDLLPEYAPQSVRQGLRIAAHVQDHRGKFCTVCGRRYFIKRTEWIEYWHNTTHDSIFSGWDALFIPILRQGCSWQCVD